MHRLIALYRNIHRWLFETERTESRWVGVQTTQGVIYAWILTRVEH